MALTREQKEQTVATMQESIDGAMSVAFMAYDALTIADFEELRSKLHESGVSMRVVPKRLLKIVMANTKLDFDPRSVEGQMAVLWSDDAVAPAKALAEFAKEREDKVRLTAGVLEGNILDEAEVKALAKLPSKQQLIGQLLSVLQGPTRGFATALSGVPRNMVYALQAIKESKE